ncbi:MAG TPA: DUF3857 domain-containing protein [Pyrinomonadaceae bacterium]|nr:DUF3857 domain-containing protein [Pyrinomonadaceae bacterium]
MKYPRPALRLCLLVCLFAAASAPALAGDLDWKPIDPAHLSMKTPLVDPDADAEAIFWEVRVSHDEPNSADTATYLSHYVRIKIFTERGRESQSRVDIIAPTVRGRSIRIKDIAGRTIRPDGTIVELKKEDIFEREVVRTSGVKVKAKSFAMPNVEPGAIIEYRWREVRDGVRSHERFDFARDIPVQFVKYYIKPSSDVLVDEKGRTVGMRAQTFQGQMSQFQKEQGWYTTSMSNVPAYREEPRMPPEYAVRPWMLVYYSPDRTSKPDEFWRDYGRRIHDRMKSYLKPNAEVKAAAAEAAGDAQTPEQKLERLYNFVRARVKRVTDDALGLTPEQLKKIKENKSAADTLKRGTGTGADIDLLFGAMASALGFEVRVAATSDRGDTFFMPEFLDDYFIDPSNIAVKVGDEWRLFSPGTSYTPFGMLRWQEEGQQTLVTDPKEPVWIQSQMSPAERSLAKRTAKLALDAEGTLTGDVRIEYTGHLAAEKKEWNDDESPAAREEAFKATVAARLAGAEVTDVQIENVTDHDKPLVYTFKVRVPGYAQRTGKRLFFQPAFFERGAGPLFPLSQRLHHIYFTHFWAEQDTVEITLPEGFAPDKPEAPLTFNAGPVSSYEPKLSLTVDGRAVIYRRNFSFSGNLIPANNYSQLKKYFDEVHKQDGHTLSLRQGATADAAGAAKSSN